MKLNFPTFLTLFRIILIPFFVLTFYLPFYWAPTTTAIIFIIAAVTDWFDGYFARRFKQTTHLGKFLDPVADKIMVSMALILISEYFHSFWITIPSAIIISREIIISALREWMAEIGKRQSIPVLFIGKIKTTMQMLSIASLLCHFDQKIITFGILSLYIAVVLTFLSMFQYLNVAQTDLFK